MVLIGKVTCYDTCFDDRETLINTDSAQHLQLQQTWLCDNIVRINFPDYCLKQQLNLRLCGIACAVWYEVKSKNRCSPWHKADRCALLASWTGSMDRRDNHTKTRHNLKQRRRYRNGGNAYNNETWLGCVCNSVTYMTSYQNNRNRVQSSSRAGRVLLSEDTSVAGWPIL